MSKYIATALRRALEIAPADMFLRHCAGLPHFVIDPSLVELLRRSDVQSSILAMREAGIARLPYPELLLEADTGSARSFVTLVEHGGGFRARMAVMHPAGALEVDPEGISIALGDEAFEITADSTKTHETWIRTVGVMTGIALLMLNIQGVEKETIEVERLNKQRILRGRPPVPRHTVMRIGHVYDREGRSHAVGGAGRRMPMHLRTGHARRQHYGEDNLLIKIVYIPPVIVNFRPGEEIRQPKRILAA